MPVQHKLLRVGQNRGPRSAPSDRDSQAKTWAKSRTLGQPRETHVTDIGDGVPQVEPDALRAGEPELRIAAQLVQAAVAVTGVHPLRAGPVGRLQRRQTLRVLMVC